MNNFDDDKIKEKLSQDKYITNSNKNVINNYINNENITPKKISRNQKSFISFLIIILLLLIALVLYLFETKNSFELADAPKQVENSIAIVDKTLNQVSNTQLSNSNNVGNTAANTVVENDFDINKFKDFLNSYAYAINRISDSNSDEIEKNTIYIYTAMKYFDTQTSKSFTLDTTNTQFAKTQENIYKFIYDITGTSIAGTLNTYKDYVTYSEFSKSYDYGANSNVLEQYSCNDVKISSEKNGIYTIIAQISRTNSNTTVNYEVTFVISLNKNCNYIPYRINSMEVKNLSEQIDTTFHLMNLYNFNLTELDNIKTEISNYLNKENKNTIAITYTILFNSIEEVENNFYQVNVTVYSSNSTNPNGAKKYAAIIGRENGKIALKSLSSF